jgi:zinc protease
LQADHLLVNISLQQNWMNIMKLTDGLIKYTLDNGLQVLLKPLHNAPLVSTWAWYHVGSKNEAPGITGASHWVEHMNFKGTTNIPKQQIKGLIENQGGFWNGYTFIDQTTYMETLAKEGLDTALFLEAERMSGSLFESDEVSSERTVIISELQGNENDPSELLDREVTASAFRAHPYGWPVIGWQSDLETMTRDDLYDHYRNYYSPDNATLVVVGDIDIDETKAMIEKHYGKIAKWEGKRRAVTTIEPKQMGERRVKVRREGTTPLLQISYHAPGMADDDFYALLLFDALLAGPGGLNIFGGFSSGAGRSSRLYKDIIDGNLAASVGGFILPTEHPYLYTIYAVLNDELDFEKVENSIYQTIEDLIHRPVSKEELQKTRNQLQARLAFEVEGITNIAHQLGFYSTIGHLESYESAFDRFATLTLDDARAAASKYLGEPNRTVGQFWPLPMDVETGGAK